MEKLTVITASVPGHISQSVVCVFSLLLPNHLCIIKIDTSLVTALYITAARLIWGFAFMPVIDASTLAELHPDASMEGGYTGGFISRPHPFSCTIVSRSQGVRELCEREEREALEALRVYEDYYD